jgi:Concanavalin A-like lectin/glucanases superfamily
MKTRSVNIFLMATTLLYACLFASCSSDSTAPPVVVKSDLSTAIQATNQLLASTSEGVAEGNYLKGSQAALIAAVAAAQAVVNDASATQEMVNNATVALTNAVATYESMIVVPIDPTNLVGQWTFDELTSAVVGTSVKDYSGNEFNGTIKAGNDFWGGGTPTLVADRYGDEGKALHFDEGSNVEIPYNTALNPTTLSISLWAKPDVNDPVINNQYMIAMNRWNGYKLQFQDSPKAFFTVKADVEGNPDPQYYDRDNASPLVTQGEWWHIVVTFGAGHMVFYLNGVMVKDWDNTPGTAVSQSALPVNLIFGQDLPSDGYSLNEADPNYLNWGGFYIGTLDEVRIYKSVLSASQVTSIYDVEKP